MDGNLKARLATAAVGVPLLVLLVGWGPSWLFAAVLFLVMVGALREYFAMAFPESCRDQSLGVLLGIVLSLAIFFDTDLPAERWLGLALVLALAIYLFVAGNRLKRWSRLPLILLGGLYGGFLLPHLLFLFRLPHGRLWMFWLLIVVMVGDTAAYFVGRRWGSKKLAPQISPGKTIEGAWGYLAGAVFAGLISAKILFSDVTWSEFLLLSLALGILGQVGDLFESWIKRVFQTKDSGHLFPGHGGILDRLDSLIFPAVFTTTYLRVFHP